MQLLSQREAEAMLARLFSRAVSFSFAITADDHRPTILLKNSTDMLVNKDRSVTWTVTELGLALHSFIELITGEETKKKVNIPLCLVGAESRQALKFLLNTTRNPADGRFNSKPAEFYIVTPNNDAVFIHMKLENLAIHYVMMQLFPPDFAFRYASEFCPFCRQHARARDKQDGLARGAVDVLNGTSGRREP